MDLTISYVGVDLIKAGSKRCMQTLVGFTDHNSEAIKSNLGVKVVFGSEVRCREADATFLSYLKSLLLEHAALTVTDSSICF